MEDLVFLNGRFLSPKEAKLPILTPGFLLGFGLFETMRSYNGRIVYLNHHLARLKSSSKLIGLKFPYSFAKIKSFITKTVKINSLNDAYVRLTLWRNSHQTDCLIVARKNTPFTALAYRRGFCADISRLRQNEDSFLAGLKTTNRILYELSFKDAKEKGFDEAIILNNKGYIAEASRSNIFLVNGKEIFAPALRCGCLNGITRMVIFDLAKKHKLKIYEGNFTLQDLYSADEAFLTNSMIGVMPLVAIKKYSIAKGRPGKITSFFTKKYNLLLKNGN